MLPIIVRLSLATLSAIVGGLLAAGLRRRASERMLPLVFVALGTLLAVTLFDVLPAAKAGLTWPAFLIAAGTGYLLFFLISRYIFSICPACAFTPADPEAPVDVNDPTVVRARSLI